MQRSGRSSPLLWAEGLSDSEPREREFHGDHRDAEPVGGVGGGLGCRFGGVDRLVVGGLVWGTVVVAVAIGSPSSGL